MNSHSPRTQAILEMAKFDENALDLSGAIDVYEGGREENRRLMPLLTELADQVTKRDELIAQALEALRSYADINYHGEIDLARDTHAALQAAINKERDALETK